MDNLLKFCKQHHTKLVVLVFWLTVIVTFWWAMQRYNLSPMMAVKLLANWFVDSSYGPSLFILFFILQPLVFFPSVVMGITAGCLYGPLLGLLYAILGANGAASVTYLMGRFLGQGVVDMPATNSRLQTYLTHLKHNTFESILTLNLLFMPFDLVNYTAGFLQVRWKPFALGTVFGSLPGTFTVVLFGASLDGPMLEGQWPQFDYRTLAISLLMLIISLTLSRYLKRRERHSSVTV